MKTYCISDVHGHYKNLKKFIETLKEDDRVFVLGDVVDKGKEPIRCLLTIMNDKRFIMLLGNHEYMMFQYLDCIPDSFAQMYAYEQWVLMNSGDDTRKPYNKLLEEEKKEVMNYIRRLPLNIPDLVVGERHFYLVHSNPQKDVQETMASLNDDEDAIANYVWERRNPWDKLDTKGKIVIAGHTPVQFYKNDTTGNIAPVSDSDSLEQASYIDIDGGLACDLENSRLIALCLDDMTYELY